MGQFKGTRTDANTSSVVVRDERDIRSAQPSWLVEAFVRSADFKMGCFIAAGFLHFMRNYSCQINSLKRPLMQNWQTGSLQQNKTNNK